MKIYSTNLNELYDDPFLRCDVDNILMRQTHDFTSYRRLTEFITFIETGKAITKEDYAESSQNVHFLVRNIAEGKPLYENLIYITEEKAEELADFRIRKDDVIIAISSNCGAAFLYEGERSENITLSHYLCRLRVDSSVLRPKYLVYYLNSHVMREYFRGVETGKTQKNLSKVYIHNLPVCLPTLNTQDKLCEIIVPYESEITRLKETILQIQDIIDKVFQREFSFDYDNFNRLKTVKIHSTDLINFGNNPDLRFSSKFHRQAGSFVMNQLLEITDKKIKHFLSEPIVLGASVSPDDYSTDGGHYYISMATIKNWSFNPEGASTVSKKFSDAKCEKTVRKNDIILARSGEGTIGKVALIDSDDIDGVFADFTMRIRLKDYNPEFAYYYFRTTYFQYLIESYKKGLGNNTNIFPIVVKELPMLDIPIKEQQRIVDEIHSEISKQDEIKSEISNLRSKINEIVESAIINRN